MTDLWKPAPEPGSELGRYRILSPTAGICISPLQVGAMSIGEAWSSSLGSMDKETSFKLLDAFFEAGGNFVDMAGTYQDEQSEAWIGEWMAARKNRDQMDQIHYGLQVLCAAANTYAKAHGKTAFSIYQGGWNVLIGDFEWEIIPMARQFGMALAPWDVMGGGKLQTKKALEERKKEGEGT
ncbi:hypothetical protein V499_00188 [Pseudogymnoascus sp. VKM F-103]|nr:hypothetical protein V499_00188 [Pseudogymnoascus sp. VKM F-103]